MKTAFSIIAKYMAIIVIITSTIALYRPETFSFLPSTLITPLLGAIMFGMGMTISLEDFRIVFTQPKDIIIGELCQFLIMPTTAYLLCKAANLPEDLSLGVILVGCCPGGTASNVITYLSRGDIALSVGMTGVSTLLAPIATPLLVWFLTGSYVEDFDVKGMISSILWIVILPIGSGLIFKHFFDNATKKATAYLPGFSSLMIIIIITIIVSCNADKLLQGTPFIIMIVMVHNMIGLATGYVFGKACGLSMKKRVAISIEVGMQNSGLASSLALLHFASHPLAAIPGAIFSVWHNISGAVIAKLYSQKIKQTQTKQ